MGENREICLRVYQAKEDARPARAKGTFFGALGYFIIRVDAIPDIRPVVEFSDYLGLLALAIASVAGHITNDANNKAKARPERWFGLADVCFK